MKGVLESKRRRTTQGFRELEALAGRVASGDPLRDTNDAGDEERHSGRTLIERTETRSIEVFLIRDKAHITTESSNRPHDDDQDDDNVLRGPRIPDRIANRVVIPGCGVAIDGREQGVSAKERDREIGVWRIQTTNGVLDLG
eukprot:Selendium_serpulae@DN6446_c1_g1_i2.p1